MGLNFKDSEAQWSYGGFMTFRRRLAAEIGIVLNEMQGFRIGEVAGGGSWDSVKDDIVPFLNHSDCDGELTPEECKRVAPRLRELVRDWPDGFDKGMAIILADDMERIADSGEALVFT